MKEITPLLAKSYLKVRKSESSKIDYGHCLLINGNIGKMGAAIISSKACLRAGVGLLSVSIPTHERQIIQISVPEAMIEIRKSKSIDFSKYNAIGIGSGLGISSESEKILENVINDAKCPLLIDADALTILSKQTKPLKLPENTIITPHVSEFDRLFGEHHSHEERIAKAQQKSLELGIIIVLKSSETVITFSDELYINTIGNPGLAKAGSGDALGGIICAFISQGYNSSVAAILGVYIHSLAADLTLKNQSVESMLISDVIESLGAAFKKIKAS